jgi:hypothetical protein
VCRRKSQALPRQNGAGEHRGEVEGKMTIYGYARVSADRRSLAWRDAQWLQARCTRVYADKISGVRR